MWAGHAERTASHWDAAVAADDVVLLPGDLSWARDLDEAAGDLAWIGARPGVKVLLRGNHDGWWASLGKVRRALPAGCFALQHDAMACNELVIVGARGWTAPDDPLATPDDAVVFARELARLRLSIADADRRFGRGKPRVAMLHYPPWIEGRAPTAVVDILREGGVETCVFGHLHGADHRLAVQGERGGMAFHLVAADAIDFTPRLIRNS